MNFFKLYIGDYMRDTGALSVAEHGAYMVMLMHHYATEKPLPEGRELHRLVRAETKAERDAVDSVLNKFWQRTDGGWINARAAKEFARASEISAVNTDIANRREAAKRAKREHEACTNRAQDVQRLEHEESTNQTPDTRHQTKNTPLPPPRRVRVHDFPPGFEAIWEAYPRKVAKEAAAKAYARLRPSEGLQADLLAAIGVQRGWARWRDDGGRFVPHLATWLNGRRWEDVEATTQENDVFAGAA